MNLIDFFRQVYGIDSVVLPLASASEVAPTPPKPAPWIVFTSNLKTDEFQAFNEMFAKITAALGLQSSEYELLLQDSYLQIPEGASVCVAFGGTQMGWVDASTGPSKQLVVSSLEEMAKHPELKKTAWTFLKQVMDYRRIDKGRAL